MAPTDERTALNRLFDATGGPLYVGIASNPRRRLAALAKED